MLKRVITTIVGLPIVLFVVFFGSWLLLLTCVIVSLIGLRELYRAFSGEDKPIHLVGYIFTLIYFAAIFFLGSGYWLLITLTLFVIVAKTCLVIFFKQLPLKDCITTIYGFLYVPFLISFIVLVREHDLGRYYVWLIFISSFGCDTFAYLTGTAFGRNKLKDSPSPSKSVEGLIGGVIGAGLLGLLYGFFASRFFATFSGEYAHSVMLVSTIIALVGAVFSIVGDMAASALKRHTAIKDFGNVFPGHGGMLDRLDSIIVVAPMVYMVMSIMIWLVE